MTETPYGPPVRSTTTATSDSPYGTTTNGSAYGEDLSTEAHHRPTPQGTDDSPSVKDKASESAEAGKQAAGQVAQQATDQAKDVAQEATQQARDLVGEARNQLSEQAGAQHRSLVTNLRSLADELSSMAQNSDSQGTATHLVSQAGDRAHSVASWLDQREPGDLLGEARSFAQRRPGTFLLGAVVAGVVAGRLTRGVVAAHSDDSSGISGGTSSGTGNGQSGARHLAADGGVANAGTQGVGYQDTGAIGGQAGYGTPSTGAPGTTPGYSMPPADGVGGVTP